MKRIAVIGVPGSGKTVLSQQMSRVLGLPHLELDASLWRIDGAAPLAEFRRDVDALTSDGPWIADGSYSQLRDLTWHRADTLVWLDYSLAVTLWRVTRRNLRRILTHEQLWNGNRMTWQRGFFSRRSVFAAAWRKWFSNRLKYEQFLREPAAADVRVIRLRSPREATSWLGTLAQPEPEPAHQSR